MGHCSALQRCAGAVEVEFLIGRIGGTGNSEGARIFRFGRIALCKTKEDNREEKKSDARIKNLKEASKGTCCLQRIYDWDS